MFAYVGGYTTPDRDGRGNGINVFRLDPVSGRWSHVQCVGGLENPSLFTLNRDGTRLYSVHGARTLVSAFAVDARSGMLRLLNQVDCGGSNPVDSALDPTERFLVVANYGSGGVAVLPVAPDGTVQPVSQLVTLTGEPGPDPQEQASSHPHGVTFDPGGRFVVVPDKGFDRTFVFRFAAGRLSPTAQGSVASAAGAAPRHAAFHPSLPVLYVNNELDSTVTVFDWDRESGHATERQVIATLATCHAGRNTTAEIVASSCGRYLYVSNRGQDSIVQFQVSPDSGLLRYAGHVPTGGARPRFFCIGPDSRHLYAANQDSDSITVFHIDQSSGSLIPTGIAISVGSPSAISFITPS
jgi:6-phosphogluconolactonase (cycloisomerase 2 family)